MWAGHTEVEGELNLAVLLLKKKSEPLPPVGSSEPSSSSVIDFKTSVTRVTVEDSTAGLGQTLLTGRPLARMLSGGIHAYGVSVLGRTTACTPGAISVVRWPRP